MNADGYQEASVLIKLLPYFDIHLDKSEKESNEVRKMLGLAKSEAEMIFLRKKVRTLVDIMKIYFDKLLMPELNEEVEAEVLTCFYGNKEKAHQFVQTLNRIVWEYNFVNKLFVKYFKLLSDVKFTTLNSSVL
jgi:hypothetical protein